MAPKKDKGKRKMTVSQGSTTRGKKRRNKYLIFATNLQQIYMLLDIVKFVLN